MWQYKTFKDQKNMESWMERNRRRYQMVVCFINNGFMVEYKKLIRIGY